MSLISSVALSLIGFAVSKCVGSSDLSDAFFSELGVGSFGDIFKDGSELALAKFFKGASNYNKDQLNHDLNKAARKSLLLATWFACRGVLLEYNYDNAKKQEKKWIAKLADSLKDKVNKSLDEVPQTSLKETDVLIIFNSQNTQAEIETNLTSKLQEEIYDIIRTDQPSFSLYTQSGFELLKNSIESGWTEQATPTSPEYHYNWFSLVCGIFNDECKTPRIEAALQNKLFKNLFIKLGEFGKSFDLLSKEITDFRNENYQQHKYTHRKLDEINTTIKSIKESFARNSKWEIIDKEFLRKISNNYSKNDAKLFFNIREPSWGDANSEFISKRKSVSEIKEKIENKINAQQPSIIQIIGNSGEGKSTIFYQSICELINTNLNLHILFPKFDDNDLEFSELFPLINSHENYLIALDNSNKFSNKLNSFLNSIFRLNVKNFHLILCCRTNDWDESENNWKIYFSDFEPIEIALSLEDAKHIVGSWFKLEEINKKSWFVGKTIDEVSNQLLDYCHRDDKTYIDNSATSFLVGLDKLIKGNNLIAGIINIRENLNIESYIVKLLSDIRRKGDRILNIYFCIALIDAQGFKILVPEILSKYFNTISNEIAYLVCNLKII